MRTNIFPVVLCAALLPLFASAQTSHRLGITGGWNQSTIHSNVLNVTDGRGSAAVGLTFRLPLGYSKNSPFEYVQEVNYVQGGGSAEVMYLREEQGPAQTTYQYHYRSFEGGTFLGWSPAPWLQLQAGGYVGLFSNRLDNNPELLLNDNADMYRCTPAYKLNPAFGGVDFGPAAGVSVGTERVRFNVRYYHGMRNLHKNLDFVSHEGKYIRTSAVRAGVAVFF
jgi:hypothetical protein